MNRIGTSTEDAARFRLGITLTRKVVLISLLERLVVSIYRLEASETGESEAVRPITYDGTELIVELLLDDVVLAAEEGEELPME